MHGGIEAVPRAPHRRLGSVGRDLDDLVAAQLRALEVAVLDDDRRQRAVGVLDEVVRQQRHGDGAGRRAVERDAHQLRRLRRRARDVGRVVDQVLAVDGQPRAVEVQVASVGVVPDDLAVGVDDGDRRGPAQHRDDREALVPVTDARQRRHADRQVAGADRLRRARGARSCRRPATGAVVDDGVGGQAQQAVPVIGRRRGLDRRPHRHRLRRPELDVAHRRFGGLPAHVDDRVDVRADLRDDVRRRVGIGDRRRTPREQRSSASATATTGRARDHPPPVAGSSTVSSTGAGFWHVLHRAPATRRRRRCAKSR